MLKKFFIRFFHALLVVSIVLSAFGLGAYWSEAKLWPYSLLADQVEKAALKGRIFPLDSDIESSFATLDLSTFLVGPHMHDKRRGGGIHAFGNSVLIMSFRGEFFLYENTGGERSLSRLDIRVDNGYQLFQEYAEVNHLDTKKAAETFRFIDVVHHTDTVTPMLLVSHHQWHQDKNCFTLRLSKLPIPVGQMLTDLSADSEDWQVVYDTQPCLTAKTKSTFFAGRESGGRIVIEDPGVVLFSVGDHGFDGWNSDHAHAQDESSDFGKVIRVDLNTGAASLISVGNRNPQGLLIDKDGTIWSTEHGPQGGDELNLIYQDANYGWPLVTYGSQYGARTWPLSDNQNRHDGFVYPVYAWVPSIGVSNLIQISGFLPEWDGDLLVASLRQKSLHRMRYRDGRMIFDETIRIGARIRDLDQLSDGTIVLWSDSTALIEIRPKRSTPRIPGAKDY